ncbi:MAG: universal stress protein [Saprospiraceae bacterium]
MPVLKDLSCEIEVQIEDENSTTSAILNARREEHADLMIMGKKAENHGTGIIPRTILTTDDRSTALALVPKIENLSLKSILTALDLSDASERVIDCAEYLSGFFDSTKTCLNIYEVPVTYFPYINIKRESLADRVKVKSHQKFKSYISSKKLDPDSWNFEILKGENIAGSIVEYANKTKPDAVIVGRIGQTNLPGNILGGVARRMLSQDMNRVMLVV